VKIFIIGGGGREHALAWRLAQSPEVTGLVASPGNPGMAGVAACVPAPADVSGYRDIALAHGANLTVVGPEAPLIAGIVDSFRQHGLKIVGPTQAAARLEGSKIYAKQFFERAGIPTAKFAQSITLNEALYTLKTFSYPMVVKADGLAAGKGVVIAQDRSEAEQAIERLGPALVIEEFLEGEEVSFIGLSNGESILPFVPTQDHKRLLEGDCGPNTGGMGAYSDRRILTEAQTSDILERIMLPTLRQMRVEGTPFSGFLYAGLMMTGQGPRILEFNVRLGDPETQAILHSFHGDLAALLDTGGSEGLQQEVNGESCSVCITLAAQGYPEAVRKGDAIHGVPEAEASGATVFHAGTARNGDNLVTNGGRVLGVTAGGATLKAAIDNAYAAASKIHFDGMQYRRDIGQKGLRRW
jgi:phosphoribosylamine--glycine ligase